MCVRAFVCVSVCVFACMRLCVCILCLYASLEQSQGIQISLNLRYKNLYVVVEALFR